MCLLPFHLALPFQSTIYLQVPKRVPMNEGGRDIGHRRNDTCHGLLCDLVPNLPVRSGAAYKTISPFSPRLSSALLFFRLDAVVTSSVPPRFQLIAPMVCVQVIANQQVNVDGSLDR